MPYLHCQNELSEIKNIIFYIMNKADLEIGR